MSKSIPVKGGNGRWLSPCSPARARQLLKSGHAVKRTCVEHGLYIQLTVSLSSLSASAAASRGGRA